MSRHYHEGFFGNTRILWGIIIIIIGLLLLLNNMEAIDLGDFISDYWPLILIIAGLYLIFRRKTHYKTERGIAGDKDIVCESSDAFYSNVFGDVDVSIVTEDFQTGKINNVFGDIHVTRKLHRTCKPSGVYKFCGWLFNRRARTAILM